MQITALGNTPSHADPTTITSGESLAGLGVMRWSWNSASRTLTCGRGEIEFYGGPRSGLLETLGQFTDIIHPADREHATAAMRPVWEAGKGEWNLRYRIANRDGRIRWIISRARAEGDGATIAGVDIDDGMDDSCHRPQPPGASVNPGGWLLKVLAQSKLGVGILDRDMKYVAVNEALAGMNGVPRDEHVGRNIQDIIGIASGQQVEAALRQILQDGISVVDSEVTAEIEGRLHRFAVQYLPVFQTGEPRVQGICCLVADISDFAKSKSELASANALLDNIFESAPIGLGVMDSDLRFVRVNRQLADMNGIPPEDHLGKSPKELFPDIQGIDHILDRWRKILETGETWKDVEVTGATPAQPNVVRSWNEKFFPIRLQDRIIGLGSIVEETTARKRAETSLKDREARLRELNATLQMALSTASAYAFVWDIEHDELRRLHDSGLAVPASGMGKISIQDVIAAVVPADREKFRAMINAALAQAEGAYSNEYRVIGLDGVLRWINARGQVEHDHEGKPLRLVGIAMDITERKQHEEKIQLLMREVSHRSKNLLAVVQAVANRTAGTGDPREFPERFGERLRGMAASHDLLVRSEWEGVEVRELVDSQLAHFGDLAEKRIHAAGPSVRTTPAASQALGMALHELATNAGKYGALSNKTGKVDISWDVADGEDGRIFKISWRESGGPPVRRPAKNGFGRVVMEQMAQAALGGHADLQFPAEGITWTLEAPAERVLET